MSDAFSFFRVSSNSWKCFAESFFKQNKFILELFAIYQASQYNINQIFCGQNKIFEKDKCPAVNKFKTVAFQHRNILDAKYILKQRLNLIFEGQRCGLLEKKLPNFTKMFLKTNVEAVAYQKL